MNKKDLDMQLKKCLLEMLDYFIETCEKLDLDYYVLGGTLLGAVRHSGFIPWDDDIDVGMPRRDYEIWLKNAQGLFPSHLFVQSYRTDQYYPSCFAKIRNSNTTFIEKSLNLLDINHGIYIDVFPLDYYPASKAMVKSFNLKRKVLYSKSMQCLNLEDISYSKSKRILRKLLSFFVVGTPFEAVIKLDKLYKSIPESNMLANYNGAWGDREIMPVEWFGKGAIYTFEGRQVKGPANYDMYLSKMYGNYMELPPIEKRVSHHYSDVIDTEKPYTEYFDLNTKYQV